MSTTIQQIFSTGDKHLSIPGSVGDIQTIISCPQQPREDYIIVVCHPHSLQGGTMNNKVVTTVARTFKGLGICSVRFNFRGVGQSQGVYDDGIGESEDLLSVFKWISQYKPDAKIILAGFSFGAYVAYRAASQWPIQLLIQVAPPVNHYDFSLLPASHCPHFVLQGEHDEVVSAAEVSAWVNSLTPKPKLICFAHTDHFFHGKLIELKAQILDSIATAL